MINEILNALNSNDIELAFELVLKYESKLNNNPDYWCVRGFLSALIKEFEVAEKCFESAIEYGCDKSDMYYNYSYVCSELNKHDDAAMYAGICYRKTHNTTIKEELSALYKDDGYFHDLFLKASSRLSANLIFLVGEDFNYGEDRFTRIMQPLSRLGFDVKIILEPIGINPLKSINSFKQSFEHINKENIEIFRTYAKKLATSFGESNYLDTISKKFDETKNNIICVFSDTPKEFFEKFDTGEYKICYFYDNDLFGLNKSNFELYMESKLFDDADFCVNFKHTQRLYKPILEFINYLEYDGLELNKLKDNLYKSLCINNLPSKTNKKYLKSLNRYSDEIAYCRSLFAENNLGELVNLISKSTFVSKEFSKELINRYNSNDLCAVKILYYIFTKNIYKAEQMTDEIIDEDLKVIYRTYIQYIIDEKCLNMNTDNLLDISEDTVCEFKSVLKPILLKQPKNGFCIVDLFGEFKTEVDIPNALLNSLDEIKYSFSKNILKGYTQLSLSYLQKTTSIKPIVVYNKNYVKQIRLLAENNVKNCFVAVNRGLKYSLYEIDSQTMASIKNKEYLNTIAVCKKSTYDGNVESVLRYKPDFAEQYNILSINLDDIADNETIIKIPLLASVTLSGFGFFCKHPKMDEVKNIELWHGGLGFKALGLLDKDRAAGDDWVNVFKNVDKFCIASNMNKMFYSSLFAIPENKYFITGMSRSDLLLQTNSRENLENLLGMSLSDKKVIFNLPTFHINEKIGRVEGSDSLQDSFKLDNFDYDRFNNFLKSINAICVSKPHYAETNTIVSKFKENEFSNIIFIKDTDFLEKKLNLYDVLGGVDLLITDYSSVAGDFIFMNKPIVFLASDIDDYGNNKGFSLEPYEFWTPGPKVDTQDTLESAIEDNILNDKLYEDDRLRLRPVFYNHIDNNSAFRCWEVIKETFNEILSSECL